MAVTVEQVEILHRAAQAKLGLYASLLAMNSFPAYQGSKAPSLDQWLELVVEQVLELRDLSSQLAVTYYQLARWMEIGRTLGFPLDSGVTTGSGLLSSFLARAQAVEDLPLSSTELGQDVSRALKNSPDHPLHGISLGDSIGALDEVTGGEGRVAIDTFSWPTLSRGERARKTIATALSRGTGLEERFGKAKSLSSGEGLADSLASALDAASRTGAAKADTLVMSAGRGVVDYAHDRDNRILMFARGTSSNPCAFCAMLASRGFVYASRSSASLAYRNGAMKSYHDNCHCFPIARWVSTSELPALNAYFESQWPQVTGKYQGQEKLNAWRRWLNQKRRESRTGVRTKTQGG